MDGEDTLNFHDDAVRAFQQWQFAVWTMVRDVLEGRPDWHFEVEEGTGDPCWRFGVGGAARLVITVQYDTLLIYDADYDQENPIQPEAGALAWWLDKNEPRHAGPTDGQVRLGGEILSSEAEQFLGELGQDPSD